MTEFKALLLIFLAMLVAVIGTCLPLIAAGTGGTVIALVAVLIGGAASHAASRVVVHYGSAQRRR